MNAACPCESQRPDDGNCGSIQARQMPKRNRFWRIKNPARALAGIIGAIPNRRLCKGKCHSFNSRRNYRAMCLPFR